jgi:hypothetical protein
MRKALTVLCVFLFTVPLLAQQRTGNIYGQIFDEEGNAIPGVSVTLTHATVAPMTVISSTDGVFRFLSLFPAKDYVIRAELAGFKTRIETGIIVGVGGNTNLRVILEIGMIEEEITVIAVSPVVDTKKTAVGINVTQDILQGLPSARDPWVVLQMAPSVISDRENIGGVESGQQATYVGRGAGEYSDNIWAMDGVVITDPAAIGASPSYYNFDAFEEMTVTVGGADVTVQTGGVVLNMITRRGGSKVSLDGRFYYTDTKFQADNLSQALIDEGVSGINAVSNIKDYGFNLGGPLWKDKAWLWGSYGVQDIHTISMFQRKDDTLLVNYAAKLNLQIHPDNRFEAFMHFGGKNKWGRSSSAAFPGGYYQGGMYHFGSPIVKLQDEHMFGDNLFLTAKWAWSNAGFNLTPMDDRDFEHTPYYDVTNKKWIGPDGVTGEWRYWVSRPVYQYNFLAQYFNDGFLGASHEIKVGFEYANRAAYTESVYVGNLIVRWNYNTPEIDTSGDGVRDVEQDLNRVHVERGYFRDYGVKALAAYISDTVSFGRFNLILGLRYDNQAPSVREITVKAVDRDSPVWGTDKFSAAAIDAIDSAIPGVDVAETKATFADGSKFAWQTLSPRLGLIYDVTGDGKTIAKLSAARYGSFMGVGEAGTWMPGGTSGYMRFWWLDAAGLGGNGNGIVDLNELFFHDPIDYSPVRVFSDAGAYQGSTDMAGIMYSGLTPGTAQTVDPYTLVDPDWKPFRTSELMLTLEREIFADFAVTLNATYRRYDQYDWDLMDYRDDYLAEDGSTARESQDWYDSAGTIPSDIDVGTNPDWDGNTGEGGGQEYYYRNENYGYTPYEWTTNRPDYHRDYYGLDLILNKRLSNKWMLNASFTLQSQKTTYGSGGYMNPNNLWATDGKPYSAYIGSSSGKINMWAFSRWLVKIAGLFQLPYDINFGFTFLAREGWIIRETFDIDNATIPNTRDREHEELHLSPFSSERLPTYGNLTIRLEKMIRLGDTGRIYLMADLFNVFNTSTMIQRYDRDHGVYSIEEDPADNSFAADANDFQPYSILNPRLLRFGVRFTF